MSIARTGSVAPTFARGLLLAIGLLLGWSQMAAAQGVLVSVDPDVHVMLPRPRYIIWPPYPPYPPPYPIPRPIPTPEPVPESSYKIKELSVQAKIKEQVARVQVAQTFVNTGSRQMEVCFMFPLPYDGAIDQLTLMVDGKEYPAKLIEAKEARKTYESIVRKNKDPALLEWIGTGMFKTSVFPVPAGAERKVTLRYSQLCRKIDGATDFLFPLSTAKYTSHPVEKVEFQVSIESENNIKNVYSPSHSVDIKRADDKHAQITFTSKNEVPTSDFRLLYDVGKGVVGATVLSYRPKGDDDGYFLLLASPSIKAADEERPKKTVIFAVDRSGSMSGEKIVQAKNALKFVLNNLREGDTFNIVAYDSEVETWRPELQKYNDESRKAALGFVEGIYAGGSTNIDGALTAALGQIKDSSRPNYVLFLTDGIPTVGETNETKIVARAKDHNKMRARIFAFGVGYDLNSRLLDKLVRANFGLSEFVRPNENIEASVSALYNRIGSPVMTDVKIKFDVEGLKTEEGTAVSRTYPKEVTDLFAGEQLVITGRYKKPGDAKTTISGKVAGKDQSFDFPAKLVDKSSDESFAFVEKLWAVRRIGEILDELDLKGKNDELVKELVTLSTRHGILTPYTSFLADENTNVRDLSRNVDRAGGNLSALRETDGAFGVEQRAVKGDLQRAKSAPSNAALAGRFRSEGYGDAAGAAPSASAPSTSPTAGAGSFGAAQGGNVFSGSVQYNGASGSGGASAQSGGSRPALGTTTSSINSAIAKDVSNIAKNVRNVGAKSFYRRGDRWIDSSVTEEQEKKAIKIERYSKEYFDLVEKLGKEFAKYLTFDEPVTILYADQAYSF